MPRKKSPLKLPDAVFSTHGDVPVITDDAFLDANEAVGYFDVHKRQMYVHTDLMPDERRRVFWHELVHLILNDCGLVDLLDEKMEEALCNGLGHYLASAQKAKKIMPK